MAALARPRPRSPAEPSVPRAFIEAFVGEPDWGLGQAPVPTAGSAWCGIPWWLLMETDPATGFDSAWWWAS
jgi:hypothetical protein